MGWRRKGQWLSLVLSSMVVAVVMEASAGSESEVVVRFVKAPHPLSALDSATFEFEVLEERNGVLCSDCTIRCKLDGNKFSDCDSRQASYRSLSEGDHMFEACVDGYREIHCASYNWTVG
ncbi:hypothetical protein AXF42_Ash007340 [Apostasia shenzhenica]|uniref:Uncharacterized protein n=1 Tax=Apostasia shenzhenica TaxID=1088818 RepID=A0A2I0B9X6_9ASPA|nr:hypothetical protein AXF42_Ash007340 [Apostasia shenzhenica]